MTTRRVLVVGAGGNLGLRLVARGPAHGHDVTAFVRHADKFMEQLGRLGVQPVRTIKGDALDGDALASAMCDQDVLVSAAGTATDGESFAHLFHHVFDHACRHLAPPRRIWMVASTAVLTIPHAEIVAAGLPGVPRMHRLHEAGWQLMERSDADWSLMCPGPMTAAPGGAVRKDLRVSVDVVPFDVPCWAGRLPRIGLSLLMQRRLAEVTVSYEDVAELMMINLANNGPFSRRRVGLALPLGERGLRSQLPTPE